MAKKSYLNLSNRERQIMDILYRQGRPPPRKYKPTCRTLPATPPFEPHSVFWKKKVTFSITTTAHATSFDPRWRRDKATRSAIRHLVRTFFNGSAEQAVTTLLDESTSKLTPEELDRLAGLIDEARSKGE